VGAVGVQAGVPRARMPRSDKVRTLFIGVSFSLIVLFP
jgi:hypothetical protein